MGTAMCIVCWVVAGRASYSLYEDKERHDVRYIHITARRRVTPYGESSKVACKESGLDRRQLRKLARNTVLSAMSIEADTGRREEVIET